MNKKGIAALIIGASLICAAGLLGFIFLVKAGMERRDARRAEEQARAEEDRARLNQLEREAGRAEAAAVFAEPTRPDPADEGEFTAVFDALGGALERGDTFAVLRSLDSDRMIRELEQIRAFDRIPGNMGAGFREGVRKGIDEKLGTMLVTNEIARWARTEVRHVRWSADRQEVMVIAVHRGGDEDNIPLRFRWWLVRRGGTWKIYDFEDMQLGLRSTRFMATMATPEMIERVSRDPRAFQSAMTALREAIALTAKGNTEGADAALAPARTVKWPPPLQALIELIEGSILLGRGDAAGALARYEEGERLFPGMPCNALMHGAVYVALNRHDEALAAVRAYRKEVGPDALSCTLEGNALAGLDKKEEAAGAFRRALDEVAGSADALNGLRRVLPNNQKKELGQRLARLKDPNKVYNELVDEARADGDDAGADALLDGLLEAKPDAHALGEDIRRKVKAEKFEEAAKILARGLKAKARADRESVLDAYLFAMLGAKKMLEGYATAPTADAKHAFRTLADELEDDLSDRDEGEPEAVQIEQLKELISAHRKRVPDDPWLWYHEGAIHQYAKEYEKAEKLLAAGAAKLPPRKADPENVDDNSDASRFRSRRVQYLFHLKRGLEAYRTVGPANDTFRQLAQMYDGEKDYTGLENLLTLHRLLGADDPEVPFWQAHLLYRKADYARAVAVYDKYLKQGNENAPNHWLARDELLRSRLRINPRDAARSLAEIGPDRVNLALRAAVAAATGDRPELVRCLEESAKNGGKTWFYSDEDFRRFIYQDKYRDLRTKYPDPNPPPKQDG